MEQINNHQYFIQEAIKEAEQAVITGDGEPFGCVIVRDGKIIVRAHNRLYIDYDPTAHAETVAIRIACKQEKSLILKDCIIYASGQPCPMCSTAISACGAKEVYYCVPGSQIQEAFGQITNFEELGLHPKQFLRREYPCTHIHNDDGLKVINSYFTSKKSK
ncbi:hypothetical protein ABPG74_006419 [Tetrahymena malaccensis]